MSTSDYEVFGYNKILSRTVVTMVPIPLLD